MIPCQRFDRPLSRRRWLGLAASLLFVAGFSADASAQAVAQVERKLLPFQLGPLSTVPGTFWDGLTFLRSEEDRQRSLKAEITFGLVGDEAGDRSLFKLNTGIALSRGVFPSEVSVVSRLGLQLRDGQLQEDVTSLQITYDYHSTSDIEYFAFAERFTDSFLSIQQRYEIGFGGRIGVRLGRAGNWRATDAHFAAVEAGLPAVRSALAGIPTLQAGSAQAISPLEFAGFGAAIDDLRHSFRDRQARLFIGMAASVFAEIERAELDVATRSLEDIGVPGAASVARIKVPVPSQQRYRLSLRPTLKLRPSAEILITVYPYFKLPLDGPRRVPVGDGSRRLDYRRDVLSEMTWSIKEEQTGLENVQFVVTVNHFYDNVPPSISPEVIAAALAAGRVFDATAAEESHRVVAIALRLKW